MALRQRKRPLVADPVAVVVPGVTMDISDTNRDFEVDSPPPRNLVVSS
jgi:hypothetical protein